MNLEQLKKYIQQTSCYEIRFEINDARYDDGHVTYDYKDIKVIDSDNMHLYTLEVENNEITIIDSGFSLMTTANKEDVIAMAKLIGEKVEFE